MRRCDSFQPPSLQLDRRRSVRPRALSQSVSVAPAALALRVRAASSTHASLKPSWSRSANHGSGERVRQTRNVPAPLRSTAPEEGGREGGRREAGQEGGLRTDPTGEPPPSSSGRTNPPELHGTHSAQSHNPENIKGRDVLDGPVQMIHRNQKYPQITAKTTERVKAGLQSSHLRTKHSFFQA